MSDIDKLPPLLNYNLELVFVGDRPGRESIERGYYYASTNNSFYKSLYESGITEKLIKPKDYKYLLKYKIGLDDVYDNPDELNNRLYTYKPMAICFNSKYALERFIQYNIPKGYDWAGWHASKYVNLRWKPIVWALYDSSGKAESYYEKRVQLIRELLEKIKTPQKKVTNNNTNDNTVIEPDGYTSLIGTRLQIKYGQYLRSEILLAVAQYLCKEKEDYIRRGVWNLPEVQIQYSQKIALLAILKTETRAEWWIEHRSDSPQKLLQIVDAECNE